MRVITHNDKIFIDGMAVEPPKPSDCICISQHNGNVYVNGFEWTGEHWKRTLRATWHWLLCWL